MIFKQALIDIKIIFLALKKLDMPHIAVISSSIRIERNSHWVALYLKTFIEKNNIATVEILNLTEYDHLPLFTERLSLQNAPAADTIAFAEK